MTTKLTLSENTMTSARNPPRARRVRGLPGNPGRLVGVAVIEQLLYPKSPRLYIGKR